jgi:small subunit ribosomal protein S16
MGKAKQPSYRVVVADSRSPRDGRFIEIIGHYSPVRQPKVLEVNTERARYWVSVGAQMSDTVVTLFKRVNILDEHGKLLPETAAAEAATPAAAEA